jgi:hypothetical protein
MRRRGHPEEAIRKVVYDNPLTFFRQCARWEDFTTEAQKPQRQEQPKKQKV